MRSSTPALPSSSATIPIARPTGASSTSWSRTSWPPTIIGRRKTDDRGRTRERVNFLSSVGRLPSSETRRTTMSELVLYDGAGTPSPRRVKLCLLEKGLPFKIKWLNLGLMDQKKPDYLKISPTGLVPALVHDGKAI